MRRKTTTMPGIERTKIATESRATSMMYATRRIQKSASGTPAGLTGGGGGPGQ
jgi:hypothetical protein